MKAFLMIRKMTTCVVLLACVPVAWAPVAWSEEPQSVATIEQRLEQYAPVRLTIDVQQLSDKQRQMIPLLIEAAKVMDRCFQYEAYGDIKPLLKSIDSAAARQLVQINYGPWDRLDGNAPFLPGVGPKPAGANFYPQDMTKEEFNAAELPGKDSQYTFLRRDAAGQLIVVPYRQQFAAEVKRTSALLRRAALLAEDTGLRRYLELRADALLTDDYQPSDFAWLDMTSNTLDVVIGPIETYEDQLFGYKAAHECYVLVKDKQWSDRLAHYAQFLPELQASLPVPAAYKQEKPGTDTELNAYDVVYYAGDCNSGSKTIAINLPNDEQVQLKKGTRRLQLKNAMRAKFDKILVPIADELIADDQRRHITFDAFFGNTMFHEVAHGLGVKNTISGEGTVREALKEHASALEEGKADVLGLYMVTSLREDGIVTEGSIEDNYITFMASIFRSIRFGTSSAHGKANLIRFNFFKEQGAFSYNEDTQTYRVNFDKIEEATNALSRKILTLQGDGDYEGVSEFVKNYGQVGEQLQASLDRVDAKGIPTDITFEQGMEEIGL